MPKKPDAFYRPVELEKALRLLQKPGIVPLAGGTQLLASEAGLDVAGVVDLQDLGLDTIESGSAALTIGAMVTLTQLATAVAEAADVAPLLSRAIHKAGPNTYRNAATLGGVVASRLPDSELLAALLVLEASMILREPAEREMSVVDYLSPSERPDGLITAVIIRTGDGAGHSERVARTPADYPIVSVTGWRPAGETVRLAATGLGTRPKRLPGAEAAVAGGMDASSIVAAGIAAQSANAHPGDFRGDAAYRAEMAAVLTRRVLQALAAA